MGQLSQDPAWGSRFAQGVAFVLEQSGLDDVAARARGARSPAELRAVLATFNLGIVPVENPGTFEWPGYWIAAVEDPDGVNAAVMFGSPSAPVHPADAHGTIVAGFVLSVFDLALPIEAPYGAVDAMSSGSVEGVFVAADAGAPMRPVPTVEAVAGRGLVGDRYARGAGTFSGPTGHEVTLVAAEAAEQAVSSVSTADLRRNIVTRGIDVNALVDRRFRVGDALLVGRRLCEPCRHLEELTGEALVRPLVHRGGLRADVLTSGRISVGDGVQPTADAEEPIVSVPGRVD